MIKISSPELTLGEKITTIFREHGVIVAAVITAIVAVIVAIVENLKAAGASVAAAIPATGCGGNTPNLPESKAILDHSKNALRWLAVNAASALPGIIGSIISWIFCVAANIVGWLPQNLWASLVAVGALIIAVINKYKQKRKKPRIKK